MTTFTTSGSIDALAGYEISNFGDAFKTLVIDFNTTFDTIDLFDANDPTAFDFATHTASSVSGYDTHALGQLTVTGTNLAFSFGANATGTYTMADFRSGTITGSDPSTFVSDGNSHFHIVGSIPWTYTVGNGGPHIHGGTLTSFDYSSATDGHLTIVGKNIAPDNDPNVSAGHLEGTAFHETLTTGDGTSVTINSTGGIDLLQGTGTINSITVSDGHNDSMTLTGTINANLLFNNESNTFVGDFVQEVLSLGANILHVSDSSIAWDGGAGNDTIIASGGGDFTISGGAGNDILTGSTGNDTLDGGAGADTMTGGTGDDTYFVDNTLDKVVEATLGGNDTVDTVVSYTLAANVENLVLNASGIKGIGNALDNVITDTVGGNTLDGGAGGNDTLIGLVGGDTFVFHSDPTTIDATGVNNTVIVLHNNSDTNPLDAPTAHVSDFTNIQNITIAGTGLFNIEGDANDNVLIGNASVNIITGDGGNDTLDGGAGADTMIGGTGSDTFTIDNIGDVIDAGGGIDTVIDKMTSGTFTMASGIDTLIMQGTGALHAVGNGQSDSITGNSGANVIEAGVAVSDGIAHLAGGAGADTYIVDNSNDFIIENTVTTVGGIDLAVANVSYDMSVNATGVEKLTLAATAGNIDGTGNALANLIVGNGGDNTLDGGAGVGIDTLQGGLGNDTYIVDIAVAAGVAKLQDMITDTGGDDTIVLRAGDLALGHATTFTLATGIENMDASHTDSANAFNLTGNTGNNILTANDHGDTLNGMTGTDTLIGGVGNDTFIVGNASDVVTGNGGTDVIQSSVSLNLATDTNITGVHALTLTGTTALNATADDSGDVLTGNGGANTLTGGAGNDTLDGGLGHDILTGGAGADTFVFTHVEAASANNSDTINDFHTGEGDAINIHDILAAHSIDATTVDNFVHLTEVSGNTVVSVNATGIGSTFIQIATLEGVTGLGDAAALLNAHNLIV